MTEYLGATVGEAMASLQLPTSTNTNEPTEAVRGLLHTMPFSTSDGALYILDAISNWEITGRPNDLLKTVVSVALEAGLERDLAERFSTNYFEAFSRLRAGGRDWNGVSHATARRLLSRLPLLSHLLASERMSCSQISRLLKALESRLHVPFQAVSVIARSLGVLPSLDLVQAGDELWRHDVELAIALFPDSNTMEACDIAETQAQIYLPEVDVGHWLRQLSQVQDDLAPINWPYLQILHFCCIPLEFFDHPASYLYEFNPRGGSVAAQVFDRYPVTTGNPVLNNAKAVQTLDRSWAMNRGGDDAHALVALLGALESLPFVTRRLLVRVIRAWLCRVIELETSNPIHLPANLSAEEIERVIAYIAQNETNTQGVLEQRIVDGLSYLAFSGAGWRPRGLGDSVNATNLSRRKLGDVEFANVDERTAIALEAHGGHLSAAYVKNHQRSLARIVDQRLEESWAALDDPEAWTIRVIFVAHSRDASGLPESEILSGVKVEYEYWDYEQLISRASERTTRIGDDQSFQLLAIYPLNSKTTRQSVRDKFVEIATPEAFLGAGVSV